MSKQSSGSDNPIKIQCRICGKETLFSPENPFRPFCSERCQMIDLGLWAQESYTVAGKPVEIEVNAENVAASEKDESKD